MLVKDIIKTANEMRQGNNFDNEVVERWIDECDASIQLEVAMKKPHEIVRLSPPKWESGKEYESGQRVSVRLSGELRIFKAKNAVMGEVSPDRDTEHWEEVPCETYVGFPHDRLYFLYVIAMMDFANQEYDKYANDIAVYNSAFEDFAKWWQRTYGYTHREGYDEYKSQH